MKNIAIVAGGYSGEFEISLGSANTVYKYLDRKRYVPYLIIIEKERWYYRDEAGREFPVNRQDFTLAYNGKTVKFDGIFNAIHGTPGEDGKLPAYFDLIGIPYSSCDMDTSSLTFNKYHCNLALKSLGIRVAQSRSFLRGETVPVKEIIDELGLPLFVKPARSGSSVGVSKVKSEKDFKAALETAFRIDDRIIVEEFLEGREFGCGVYRNGNALVVLPITEIISKKEFFDYEAKYSGSLADEITPAENLSEEDEIEIKATSALIYNKLACKGIIRADFMLTSDGVYLIEINSIPGLAPNSIIPKQAAAMGISLTDLLGAVTDAMF